MVGECSPGSSPQVIGLILPLPAVGDRRAFRSAGTASWSASNVIASQETRRARTRPARRFHRSRSTHAALKCLCSGSAPGPRGQPPGSTTSALALAEGHAGRRWPPLPSAQAANAKWPKRKRREDRRRGACQVAPGRAGSVRARERRAGLRWWDRWPTSRPWRSERPGFVAWRSGACVQSARRRHNGGERRPSEHDASMSSWSISWGM